MTGRVSLTDLREWGEERPPFPAPDATDMAVIEIGTLLALVDAVEAAHTVEWRGLPSTWVADRRRHARLRQALGRFTGYPNHPDDTKP